MKHAYINGIILDGSKEMEPQQGKVILTDGENIEAIVEKAQIKDKDLAISRVIRMVKEGKVESINGKDIAIKADSICVHGDNPKALEFVKNIRQALEKEQIEIKCLR